MDVSDHSSQLYDTKSVLQLYKIPKISVQDCKIVKRICELVGTRAARLSAAGIAAVITKMNKWSDCTVAIDGSLFEFYPHFGNRMRDALREMVGMTQDNISMVQGILFLEMKRVLD
jgi:hexokinase